MRQRLRWCPAMRILLILLLCMASRPAAAAPPPELSIAAFAPTGSPWSRALHAWATTIERQSRGTLRVRLIEGGDAGSDREVLSKLDRGLLDGAHLAIAGLRAIATPVHILETPQLIATEHELDAARDELGPTLDELFLAAGYRRLAWADLGYRYLFSRTRVVEPDHMRNVRLRLEPDNGFDGLIAQRFGTNGVPVVTADVLAGLQTAMVDAVQAAPAWMLVTSWFRYTPRGGVRIGPAIGAVMISDDAYGRLSRAHQRIVDEASAELEAELRTLVVVEEAAALASFASRGMLFDEPSAALLDGFRAAGARGAGRLFPLGWIERVEAAIGRR
jgi:TRAP-type C4-dicarboxylate transport system substrate-binding protein